MKKTLLLFAFLIMLFLPSRAQTEFSSGDLIYRIITPGEVEVCGYHVSNVNILSIPSTVRNDGTDYQVVAIASAALAGNHQLVSVTIPSSVLRLESSAFGDCSNLQLVNLSNGLERIENDVFANCQSLREINIPASVNFIQMAERGPSTVSGSFNQCNSLAAINVDDNNRVYASKDGVLYDKQFRNLYKVPSAVPSLELPSTLNIICTQAAIYCINLTSVVIPDSVTLVDDGAFGGCDNLTDIVVGDGVIEIGNGTFSLFNLHNITLGKSLKKIGISAFAQTFGLEHIDFPDSLEEIGEGAFGRTGLKEVKLPASLKNLGQGAFWWSENLEYVDLSLTQINILGAETFTMNPNLKTVQLPATLQFIGGNVFGQCPELEYLQCLATTPPSCSANTFESYHYDKVGLQVPTQSQTLYETTTPWSYFKKIVNTQYVPISNVEIKAPYNVIQNGSTLQLSANVSPANATNPVINWEVERNEEALSVDNTGLLTTHGYGESSIKVTAENSLGAVTDVINFLILDVVISGPESSMKVGENYELYVSINPWQNANDFTRLWRSSDQNIVSVDNLGIITAQAPGVATITVSLLEYPNIQASYQITVVNIEPEYIGFLNYVPSELKIGETYQLDIEVYPPDAIYTSLKWTSSNENVASVSQTGFIQAISEGETEIKVWIEDFPDVFNSFSLRVNPIIAENIILNMESADLNIGESVQLEATVLPDDTTDKSISWNSSDPNVATVSESGLVNAISEGSVIITANCGEAFAECVITVINPIVDAEQIVLNMESADINIGESVQLEATVLPDDTTDKSISWNSSDPNVATVSESGLVSAISEGFAIITANCGEAFAECVITVINPVVDAEQIVLNMESADLNIGEFVQLEATVLPEDTTDKSISWNSSDPNVATVSDNGLVTAVSPGSAIITADCGEASAQCVVSVLEEAGVEGILANPDLKISIYTPHGILIKKDCKIEDLKILSKGIYIVISGKDRYKISI